MLHTRMHSYIRSTTFSKVALSSLNNINSKSSLVSCFSSMPSTGKYETGELKSHHTYCVALTHRSIIRAAGRDTKDFLQNLLSNDMACLDRDCSALYSLMLNIQGRVMYDLLLYKIKSSTSEEPIFLAEVDSTVVADMLKEMKKYKIRKKVDLTDVSDQYKSWAILPDKGDNLNRCHLDFKDANSVVSCNEDPRLKAFGCRLILNDNLSAVDVISNTKALENIDVYHSRRFRIGIGEGVKDMPPGNCFPLESNAVWLNGVSFDKGCYIGQELTARTYHTGVTRKRLMPIVFNSDQTDSLKSEDTLTNIKGKNVGKIRNVVGQYGIGLVRFASAEGTLKFNGQDCVAVRPSWWPTVIDK